MTAIFLLGFLAFIFSLIYLVFHFIQKIKDRSRTISKKIFYPTFIGGLLFLIIGGSYMDTGAQAQLDEQLVKNEKLVASNAKLEKENERLEKENKNSTSKIADYKKKNQELKDQQASFETEKEDLNKQISDLTAANTNLQNEVSSLNTQLASKNSTTSTATTTSSGSYESFANCTELRTKYPNGVPSTHPAYESKHDRDKDNFACER